MIIPLTPAADGFYRREHHRDTYCKGKPDFLLYLVRPLHVLPSGVAQEFGGHPGATASDPIHNFDIGSHPFRKLPSVNRMERGNCENRQF